MMHLPMNFFMLLHNLQQNSFSYRQI